MCEWGGRERKKQLRSPVGESAQPNVYGRFTMKLMDSTKVSLALSFNTREERVEGGERKEEGGGDATGVEREKRGEREVRERR